MRIFTILFILFGGLHPETEPESYDRSSATLEHLIASANYLSPDEKAMVWEINLVRTEPSAYIPLVEEELIKVVSDSVRLSSIISESIRKRVSYENDKEVIEVDTIYTNYYENRVQAIRELIMDLGSSVPLSGLIPLEPLYTAAVKHGDAQAPGGYIDHLSSDGTWPLDRQIKEAPFIQDGNENIARAKGSSREVVLQLLIDSGVPHRGHRKNILNPEWKYVTCHHVRQMDESSVKWWIQEFAY